MHSTEETQMDVAFQLETEGIGMITEQKRHGKPSELFFVWFAATMTFTSIVIGQLFTSLGLSVAESLIVDVLCSLSFIGVGFVARSGPKAGTVTLTISRAAFGIKANRIPAFFSWMSAVGWESVTTVLTVLAMLSLAQFVGLPSQGVGPTIIALLITLVLTYSVPILGHATVVVMQRWLALALGIFGVILVVSILPHVNWAFTPPVKDMAASGLIPTLLLAASIGLISTMYGWTNFAADYSRYLPKKTSAKHIVSWTLFGGGIATFIAMGIGILLGSYISAAAYSANPVMAIAKAVPTWAAIPFLLVVIIGDITANYLNAYSSGMSFLSMGIRIRRQWAVVIDGVLCTAIALYALFISQGFVNFFENFLSLNIIVIGPWTAIYMVHDWLSGSHYDGNGLLQTSSDGPYFYTGGWNIKTIIAFGIGIVATFFSVNSALWVSPLSTHFFGGADISAYVALIVTGVVYALLYKKPHVVAPLEQSIEL